MMSVSLGMPEYLWQASLAVLVFVASLVALCVAVVWLAWKASRNDPPGRRPAYKAWPDTDRP